MLEMIDIKKMPKNLKITLLQKLGYDSDGNFVLKDGKTNFACSITELCVLYIHIEEVYNENQCCD